MNNIFSFCMLLCLPSISMAGVLAVNPAQEKALGIVTRQISAQSTSIIKLSGEAVAPNALTDVVSAPAAGVVQSIKAELLQAVSRGTALAVIASPEGLEAQKEFLRVQGDARLAQARLARDEALFKEGLIAAARLEETRVLAQQAQASLQQQGSLLRLQGINAGRIADASSLTPQVAVTAPSAGSIEQQYVNVGQRVALGDPLFRIVRKGALWLDLHASPQQRESIRVGQSVSVGACTQRGRVVSIGTSTNGASQTLLVRAELPDPAGCVHPNQFVDASIEAHGLSVPDAAIVKVGGDALVFVRAKGGFESRPLAKVGEGEVVIKGTAALKAMLVAGESP